MLHVTNETKKLIDSYYDEKDYFIEGTDVITHGQITTSDGVLEINFKYNDKTETGLIRIIYNREDYSIDAQILKDILDFESFTECLEMVITDYMVYGKKYAYKLLLDLED